MSRCGDIYETGSAGDEPWCCAVTRTAMGSQPWAVSHGQSGPVHLTARRAEPCRGIAAACAAAPRRLHSMQVSQFGETRTDISVSWPVGP